MSTTTSTTVGALARKARTGDHAAIATALAAAFHADPVFRWLTPDDEQRRHILPTFFDLAIDIFRRHDDIWCIGEDGGVAGGAIWSPAGVDPMDEADGERFVSRCAELAGPEASRWEDVIALLAGSIRQIQARVPNEAHARAATTDAARRAAPKPYGVKSP